MVAEGTSTRYDAFISYSHAADGLLAPRLQTGIQRFAKPWWKRRAVRVFRDESSLSASPHLWGSIVEALDSSSWFVLLLSPEAASSEWVNKEVDYWTSDPSRAGRVLPVVTDGEFYWDGDVIGSAVPPSLGGVFAAEPRWVDLRSARGETQLSMKNPEFAGAVADIAAAIRGVPKDELESEEVRQHRRTLRTAWVAGLVVLLLAVTASAAALFAFNERSRANAEARRATEQADLARQERDRAVVAEEEAAASALAETAARLEAESAAQLAQAREVVLEAEKALLTDPELSIHLSLFSLDVFRDAGEDTTQAVGILRDALAAVRAVRRLPGGTSVDAHPDRPLIATVSASNSAVVMDATTAEVLAEYVPPSGRTGIGEIRGVVFDPTGSRVAVQIAAAPGVVLWDWDGGVAVPADELRFGPEESVGRPNLVFDPTGENLAWQVANWGFVNVWNPSEDQTVFESHGGLPPPGFIMVEPGSTTSNPDYASSGLLAYAEGNVVHLVDPALPGTSRSLNVIGVDSIRIVAWSPDDAALAVSDGSTVVVLDAGDGRRVSVYETSGVSGLEWVDSERLLVGSGTGLEMIGARSGSVEIEFLGVSSPGENGFSLAAMPQLGVVAVTSENEDHVVLVGTAPNGGFEIAGWPSPVDAAGPVSFTQGGTRIVGVDPSGSIYVSDVSSGAPVTIWHGGGGTGTPILSGDGRFAATASSAGRWLVRSTSSGDVRYQAPVGSTIQGLTWDGSAAVVSTDEACGSAHLVRTDDGSTLGDVTPDCGTTGVQGGSTRTRRFHFSPDSTLMVIGDDAVRIERSGESLWPACWCHRSTLFGDALSQAVAFTPDSSVLVAGNSEGVMSAFDVSTLQDGGTVESALLSTFRADDKPIAQVAVSGDGSMTTTAVAGGPVRLWDVGTGKLLGEFGEHDQSGRVHYAAFHPTLQHLLVVSPSGEVRVYTLDLDELVQLARERLTSSLTESECQQYLRTSCAP